MPDSICDRCRALIVRALKESAAADRPLAEEQVTSKRTEDSEVKNVHMGAHHWGSAWRRRLS